MRKHFRVLQLLALAAVAIVVAAVTSAARAPAATTATPSFTGTFKQAVAADVSKPLRVLAQQVVSTEPTDDEDEDGPATDNGFTGDASKVQTTLPSSPTIARPLANFEGLSNQDNFNHLRRAGQPARSGRRRRPEQLRRDGQPRVRRLRQDGNAAARPGRHRRRCGRTSRRRLHRAIRRPDRGLRPDRGPLDPHASSRRAASTTRTLPLLQLRRGLDDRRPDRRVLPLRVLTDRAATSPTTRSTACGRTRTSSRRASSAPTVEYGIGVYGAREEQDAQRPAEGACRALLPRRQRPGDAAARRRRPAPRRHRRQAEAARPTRRSRSSGTQDDGGGYGATFDALNIWDLEGQVALDAR